MISNDAMMDWVNQRYQELGCANAGQLPAPHNGKGYTLRNSRNGSREMTAEDLGLSLRQWDPEWLTDMYGLCPWRIWDRFLNTDAPYAFWLGAEG